MAELEVGRKYDITAIKTVNTQYGASIVTAIEWEFTVFLPKRISKVLEENPEQLVAMSEAVADKNLQLHYLGGEFNRFEFCYKTSV